MRNLVIGIIASTLAAQQQPSQESPQILLKATARLVQISVVVHDKKGPVADLRKENFQIKVDGQTQTISLFSVESAGSLPGSPEPMPPNTFTNRLEQRPGTPSGVTIILLDALNTRFEDQAFARQEIIKYLKTIRPTDHIGLYSLAGSLRVLEDYTTDATDLLRKLEGYKGDVLPGTPATHDPLAGDALFLDQWLRGDGAGPAERSFYTTNRIEGTLHALEFIANHLSRLPGRKNLIWVSGGFPLSIGFDNLRESVSIAREQRTFGDDNLHEPVNPAIEQRTFGDEVNRTVRALNNANIAIYPVDARGLMTDPRFEASRPNVNFTRVKPRVPPPPVGVRNQESMWELASRTGGRAYLNTNDLKNAIRDAVSDTQVAYTLGFYPINETYDSKFHEIKVQVLDRSGVNLRYRKGYFDLPELPQDETARRAGLRDAVWSPLDATAVGLTVEVKPVNRPAPNSLEVYVKIDRSSISLEQNKDRWAGRLDVLFVQKDNRGNQYRGVTQTVDLKLLQANYEKVTQGGLIYKQVLERERRANQIRVVVRDAASGSIGSVTVPFDQLR